MEIGRLFEIILSSDMFKCDGSPLVCIMQGNWDGKQSGPVFAIFLACVDHCKKKKNAK